MEGCYLGPGLPLACWPGWGGHCLCSCRSTWGSAVCPRGQATSPPWRRFSLTLRKDQTHITIIDPKM